MALIYLAYPYFAPTVEEMQRNRRNAMAWGVWIAKTFGVAVSANWIWWCEHLTETPENRELGLQADDQEIAKCDEFWMVGGRISEGMKRGWRVAADTFHPSSDHGSITVRDLTSWGWAAPTFDVNSDLTQIERREITLLSIAQLHKQLRAKGLIR